MLMTSKLFKSYKITPELTIDTLTYGISQEPSGYFIFLKKRKCQWAKRHGPFKYLEQAKWAIQQIKDEYNAISAKRSKCE